MGASTRPEEATRREEALLDALVQTSFTVIDTVASVATAHGLSLTLLRVIAILRDRTPTMSELAVYLDLDRSTITGLIDRASTRGLLHKFSDDLDRRSSRVALTRHGHELAAICATDVASALLPLVAHLTPTQHLQLTMLLETLGPARVERPS